MNNSNPRYMVNYEEAYRAVISKGVFENNVFNIVDGAVELTAYHMDVALGGSYSCSYKKALMSASKKPFELYNEMGMIPGKNKGGVPRNPDDDNARDAIIAIPMNNFLYYVFDKKSVPANIHKFSTRKIFMASHCALRRKDNSHFDKDDVELVLNYINQSYRVVTPDSY